jgi:hypothetical protein
MGAALLMAAVGFVASAALWLWFFQLMGRSA